jgi:hypothetical protein
MKSFSQRIGIEPVRVDVQKNNADHALRNELWNAVYIFYFKPMADFPLHVINEPFHTLYTDLWSKFFNQGIDKLPYNSNPIKESVKQTMMHEKWNKMYEILEFLPNHYNVGKSDSQPFCVYCNSVLEKHLSAYRFANMLLSEITSNEEIDCIEEALNNKSNEGAVRIHLRRSLELYSDRKSPDYRNSIKESISAVEAFCKNLTGDNKATLGKALAIIEKKHALHGSLKSAFDKLYGYTSDAAGIRHSLLDETDLKQEDAKFMLVTCTAFINYLVVKSLP